MGGFRDWVPDSSGLSDPRWVWGRAFAEQNSQYVWPRYKAHQEPLPLVLRGHTPTAGAPGLARAQDRCRWDIEGMLRLLRAIEEAPDLTENQVHRHERQTLGVLLERQGRTLR